MGSRISLQVDEISLDFGKNAFWTNHAQLFQPHNYLPTSHNEDIYEEPPDESEPPTGKYVRTLGQTIGRLDLLGYSEDACRSYVKENVEHVIDDTLAANGDYDDAWVPLEPDWVLSALSHVNLDLIKQAQQDYIEHTSHYTDNPKFVHDWLERIQLESKLTNIPTNRFSDVLSFLHLSFDFPNKHPDELCHPYVVLRLLGTNPSNLDRQVKWDHSDLVAGEWADPNDFLPYLDPTNQILVVTEGSSDASVLKKSLEQLRPDIADFFYFVDMTENYPFTGTGNLFRFTQGLSSINIQNKTIIIYDNDAEGCFNFNRTTAIERPPHLGVIRLPSLTEFANYPTIGPEGQGQSDINGRAVSIELFLKSADDITDPPVRWTSYHEKNATYQGVIDTKTDLVKRFMNPRSHPKDFPRIESLLNELLAEATRISVIARRYLERGNSHPWTFSS